ncbi:winged helix-turn-helix domain-containing protein [Candidatus Desulfatibia sp.]
MPEKEQEETLKNGASRVRNQVAWARFHLTKAGFLDSFQNNKQTASS